MKRLLFALAVAAALFTSHFSFAQTATPVVRHRQIHQQHRIANGIRSGQLTPREARHLEGREAKLQHDKRMAKADGLVTRRERRHLRLEQNRDSRAIYRQKHDGQTAY